MRFALCLLVVMRITDQSTPVGAQTPTIKPPKPYVFREIALENKRESILDRASQGAIVRGLDPSLVIGVALALECLADAVQSAQPAGKV